MKTILVFSLILFSGCAETSPNIGHIHMTQWVNHLDHDQRVCMQSSGAESCWMMPSAGALEGGHTKGDIDLFIPCKTDSVRITVTDISQGTSRTSTGRIAGLCGQSDWRLEISWDFNLVRT